MGRTAKKGPLVNQKLLDFLGTDWGESDDIKDEAHGGSTKVTAEDIQQYTVSDDLDDIHRIDLYLSSSLPIQQCCGMVQLPSVADEIGPTATSKLLVKALNVCQKTDDIDVQLQLIDALTLLFENDKLSQADVKLLVGPAFKKLQSSEEDVRNGFLDILMLSLDKLPSAMIVDLMIHPSLSLGEVHCPVSSRVNCCRLLGKMSTRLNARLISDKFFFKAMSLCQDTAYEVRATMCEQLDSIARGVGPELTHSSLLEELNELLKDEEALVKSAALEAVINLLDFFNDETKRTRVLPQLRAVCRDTPDAVVYSLADKVGLLLTKLQPTLGDDKESEIFYSFFKKIATNADVELRRRCVFNLPAIVLALGTKRFPVHVEPVVRKFSEDSDLAVRLCLVRGFHEISNALSQDRSVKLLKAPLIALLRDPSVEVKEALLANLSVILSHFDGITPQEERSMTFRDIVCALAETELSLRGNWRRELLLIRQLESAALYFSDQQLHDLILPILTRYMQDSILPVKEAAIPLVCKFLRSSRNMQHRFELTQRLVREFGRARSFNQRMLFADICIGIINEFSRMYFRQYFFEPACDLLNDPVPNVRMRMCKVLPRLKTLMRLPDDQTQLERLTGCMNKLLRDRDAVVVEMAESVQSVVLSPLVIPSEMEADEKSKRQDEESVQRLEAEATKRRMVDEATERAKASGSTTAAIGRKPIAGLGVRRSDSAANAGDMLKRPIKPISSTTSALISGRASGATAPSTSLLKPKDSLKIPITSAGGAAAKTSPLTVGKSAAAGSTSTSAASKISAKDSKSDPSTALGMSLLKDGAKKTVGGADKAAPSSATSARGASSLGTLKTSTTARTLGSKASGSPRTSS